MTPQQALNLYNHNNKLNYFLALKESLEAQLAAGLNIDSTTITETEDQITLAQSDIDIISDDRTGAIVSPLEVGFVTGYILHSITKQPIFGCDITSNDNLRLGAKLEENGTYVLAGKYGSYSVTVSKVGFKTQSKSVAVTANSLTVVN